MRNSSSMYQPVGRYSIEVEDVVISPENRVIVRVWTSWINGGKGVGHVSVEVPAENKYISFWPEQAVVKARGEVRGEAARKAITNDKGVFLSSYAEDVEYEGRAPEFIYCFYSLKKQSIIEEFRKIENTNPEWHAQPSENNYNCATLARRVLEAGEIGELLKDISNPSEHLPDITNFELKHAHRQERNDYEKTRGDEFNFVGETPFIEVVSSRSCCRLM